MKAVTASEMREIDRKTIEEIGIHSIVLMERAGLASLRKSGSISDANGSSFFPEEGTTAVMVWW